MEGARPSADPAPCGRRRAACTRDCRRALPVAPQRLAMALLKTLGTGQGYLKAGFLGFQKSGKSYTAAELAIGVRQFFKLAGPIAMFDTEGGSEYLAGRIKQQTGADLVGVRSRAFDDMVAFGHECVAAGVAVAIVDSVTHT